MHRGTDKEDTVEHKHTKVVTVVGAVLAVALTMGVVGLLAQGPMGQHPWQGPGMRGPGPMGGGPFMGGPSGEIMRELRSLDLTDAQIEKIRATIDTHKDEIKAIADRMMAAREALHAAIVADPIDEGAIREKAGAVGAVEADAAVLHAKVRAEVFATLTPEQQQKARDLGTRVRSRVQRRLHVMRGAMGRFLDPGARS